MDNLKAESEAATEREASAVERIVINRYVYHYCAHYQDNVNEISYIDGIAQVPKRIACMEDYTKLKYAIDCPEPSKLTIDSLSFLGMEEEL